MGLILLVLGASAAVGSGGTNAGISGAKAIVKELDKNYSNTNVEKIPSPTDNEFYVFLHSPIY